MKRDQLLTKRNANGDYAEESSLHKKAKVDNEEQKEEQNDQLLTKRKANGDYAEESSPRKKAKVDDGLYLHRMSDWTDEEKDFLAKFEGKGNDASTAFKEKFSGTTHTDGSIKNVF